MIGLLPEVVEEENLHHLFGFWRKSERARKDGGRKRMIEIKEELRKMGEDCGVPVSPCKRCGGFPELMEMIDEQGWKEVRIDCGCGLTIPVSSRRRREIVDLWNRVNAHDHYEPATRPCFIGGRASCATCLQQGICLEARKVIEEGGDPHDFICGEHVEDKPGRA